ncbi:MAG: 5'-methylthioadenosine nucleosidase [Oligoflexia bacterium]|nr:5'-methylthioadenosine nucleosidase [Oligoflexia bacterium]
MDLAGDSRGSFKRIALLFAMEAEARPFVERLGLSQDAAFGDPRLPFVHYRGRYGNSLELLLSVNGRDPRFGVDNIGTEPATLNAYVTLRGFAPQLCISAGTAGGFRSRGGAIGDVYVSDRPLRFHDRRIPLPGFDAYGVGSYPAAPSGELARAVGLKQGGVSTGNSLDHTEKCLELIERGGASVKEMEAAAIAWVAWCLGTPFLALKAITDLVDGEHATEEEFLRNLEAASRALGEKLHRVLEYLDRGGGQAAV